MKKLYCLIIISILLQFNAFGQSSFPLDIGNKWYYQGGSTKYLFSGSAIFLYNYGIIKEVTAVLENGFREIIVKYYYKDSITTSKEYWRFINGKFYANDKIFYDDYLTKDSCINGPPYYECWSLIPYQIIGVLDTAQTSYRSYAAHSSGYSEITTVLPGIGVTEKRYSYFGPSPRITEFYYLTGMNRNGEILGDTTIRYITTEDTSWTSQSSKIFENLRGVCFWDQKNGSAVGDNGKILSTTNGGESWSIQSSGASDSLYSVSFSEVKNGIAIGTNGAVLKTTNAGITWALQSSGNSGTIKGLFGVSLTNANDGIVVGEYGTILRTKNGGVTWTSQSSGTDKSLHAIYFVNETTGTAVGDFGIILRTTDGGTTWNSQLGGTTCKLRGVFFTDINNGTIVGEYGTILRTTNSGTTWYTQSSGTRNFLYSVSFSDKKNGTAVGQYGAILKTTNEGTTWNIQFGGTEKDLFSVFSLNGGFVIAVGVSGTIIKTNYSITDSGSTNVLPEEFILSQNFPNPFNLSTIIRYQIPQVEFVSLKIYDLLGRHVTTLVNKEKPAGSYEIEFNAGSLSSGVYFYKFEAGSYVETKKLILMK